MSNVVENEATQEQQSAPNYGYSRAMNRPIVVKYKKKKRKKRRYSRGLRGYQRSERDFTRALLRGVNAPAVGLRAYRRRSNRSARRRRDGAIIDFAPNVGRGFSRSLREASDIPEDFARAIAPRRSRRRFRRVLRRAARRSRRPFFW